MAFGHGTPSERRVHRVSKIVGEDLVVLDLLEVKRSDDAVWADRQVIEWQGKRVVRRLPIGPLLGVLLVDNDVR